MFVIAPLLIISLLSIVDVGYQTDPEVFSYFTFEHVDANNANAVLNEIVTEPPFLGFLQSQARIAEPPTDISFDKCLKLGDNSNSRMILRECVCVCVVVFLLLIFFFLLLCVTPSPTDQHFL
jgi:hypothetical protein